MKKRFKSINFRKKIINASILLLLTAPFSIKREDIMNTNDDAYRTLYTDENYDSKVYFDAYSDDINKLEDNDIKILIIRNISYLTDEEKEIIRNNSNLEHFIINYGLLDINDQNIDLDFINPNTNVELILDEVIKNCRYDSKDSELYNFLLYKKCEDYKKQDNVHNIYLLEPYNEEDIEKFKFFDSQLTKIINILELDNIYEDTKLIKIYNYVTLYLNYDHKASRGTKESAYYNSYLLSSILNQNPFSDSNGICCNYSALATVLGYYAGVDLDYIFGSYDDKGHAWNKYIDDGNDVIIDSTFLDGDNMYESYKNSYYGATIFDISPEQAKKNLITAMETSGEASKKYYKEREVFSFDYDIINDEYSYRAMLAFITINISHIIYDTYIIIEIIKKYRKDKKTKKLVNILDNEELLLEDELDE